MGMIQPNTNVMNRGFRTPWDEAPRKVFTRLVESQWLKPGRVIELGSGAARNAIYLASKGFDVTGVDCDPELVEIARRNAMRARVSATFVLDDLTQLRNVEGPFDALIDYSTMDDLTPQQRDLYVRNVLPLTQPGSQFMLYCLEWALTWWEKLTLRLMSPLGFGPLTLEPGEVDQRFGEFFHIRRVAGETRKTGYPRGYAVYMMTRKDS